MVAGVTVAEQPVAGTKGKDKKECEKNDIADGG
jgi:hypothetical protein